MSLENLDSQTHFEKEKMLGNLTRDVESTSLVRITCDCFHAKLELTKHRK